MKFCILALSALAFSVSADDQHHQQLRRELKQKKKGGDGGRPVSCDLTTLPTLAIPVKQSIVDFRAINNDGTDGDNGNFDPTDFPNPPCGKDFDADAGVNSKHGCTYFPSDGSNGTYECECKSRKCQEFLDSAIRQEFFETEADLCALEGFELKVRRQWFWVCECTDPLLCGSDKVLV